MTIATTARSRVIRNTVFRAVTHISHTVLRSYIYLILIPNRSPLEEDALFLEGELLWARGARSGAPAVSQCVTRSLLCTDAFDEDYEDREETTTTDGHCAVSQVERGRLASLVV